MAIATKIKKAAEAAANKAKQAQPTKTAPAVNKIKTAAKDKGQKVAYYSKKNKGITGMGRTLGKRTQQPKIQGKTGAVRYHNPLVKDMAWRATGPVDTEVWRKQRSNFKNWMNSLPYERKAEDKGTTLAQAKRRASLWGAVYPTTRGYTKDQARDLQSAIQDAPVDLQNLFIKYGSRLSPMEPVPPDDTSAYFSRKYGEVFGDPSSIAKESRTKEPYRTHWHEYGHNLDWLAGGNGLRDTQPMYSQTYTTDATQLQDTVASDMDNTLRQYWTNVKGDYKPYNADEALSSFLNDMSLTGPSYIRRNAEFSDIISPYSSQRGGSSYPLGYGHDAEYWRNGAKANSEAFANMTSASVTGGPSLRHVQAFLPNAYDQYLEMLARMSR